MAVSCDAPTRLRQSSPEPNLCVYTPAKRSCWTRDLHDRDRIVVFLTREHGKKSGVARGSRTRHSRFAGQLQPLGKVQVTWFAKEGSDLVRISSVELVRPVHRLQEDLEGILLCTYLADHMLEFAQEDEGSDLLYRLLDSTLEALLEGVDRDLAARYFESWVLRLGGIFPAPDARPQARPRPHRARRAATPWPQTFPPRALLAAASWVARPISSATSAAGAWRRQLRDAQGGDARSKSKRAGAAAFPANASCAATKSSNAPARRSSSEK